MGDQSLNLAELELGHQDIDQPLWTSINLNTQRATQLKQDFYLPME